MLYQPGVIFCDFVSTYATVYQAESHSEFFFLLEVLICNTVTDILGILLGTLCSYLVAILYMSHCPTPIAPFELIMCQCIVP